MRIPIAVQWVFRLIVGGVFLYFGVPKILAPDTLATAIINYDLVPQAGINLLALILPWLEVIAALVLIVGPWRREAAALSAGMCVMFIAAISSALARGLSIDCGCTAEGGSPVSWLLVGMDSGLLLLSLALMIARTPTRAGFPVETTTPEPGES